MKLKDIIINEEEDVNDGRIPKPAVLYEGPEFNKMDFTCSGCIFFSRDDRCEILKPYNVKTVDGCNLWVGGEPKFHGEPLELVPKEVAGFLEGQQGFTCGRCKHFHQIKETGLGECEIVQGPVRREGCCNAFEYATTARPLDRETAPKY